MDKHRTDTQRLDALQKLGLYDLCWICRISNEGRGLRLHQTTRPEGVLNIREAIDNYLDTNSVL